MILTDDFADKEGLEMGDEYFANLDHIESVENFKEGYESEAHCSDSDGSGVDMSRVKSVSLSVTGRASRKAEDDTNSGTGGRGESRPRPRPRPGHLTPSGSAPAATATLLAHTRLSSVSPRPGRLLRRGGGRRRRRRFQRRRGRQLGRELREGHVLQLQLRVEELHHPQAGQGAEGG